MSRSSVRRTLSFAVLLVAILPWVVTSQSGDGRASAPSTPERSAVIESVAAVLVVASDRPSIAAHAKRSDGPRTLSAINPRNDAHAGTWFAWDLWPSGSVGWTEPIALHLAERGPPSGVGD